MKLTKVQREVLALLCNGAMMVIDKYNMSSIKGRNLSLQTRSSLLERGLITRKDKSKPVNAKGNGFVISEKGRHFLTDNHPLKTRKASKIIKKEKTCPECKLVKPIDEFVTVYGVKNPRGKYCKSCFELHQQQHAMSLMEGRDYCLYCGRKIQKAYDWTPEGNSEKTYLHCDHMDPLSLGGRDSKKNTVYCCVKCNLQKGNKLYSEWLMELSPDCREVARSIYIKKQGRAPEDFKPGPYRVVVTVNLVDVLKKL